VTIGTKSGTLLSAITYVDAPSPVIADFSPRSGPTGGGTAITIVGSGFATNATVRFGAASATQVQVQSATQLTCFTPAGAGGVQVRVTNPSTGLAGVSPALYSYGDAPVVASAGGGSSSGCSLGAGREGAAPGAAATLGLALVLGALITRRERLAPR
jgi:hypothetical protein